jgi:hypothetical protein
VEDPPVLQKLSRILELAPGTIDVFGGLGGEYFLEELQRGAKGIMTGFAFPEVLVGIHRAFTAGDEARATELFDRYCTLIRYEFQPKIGLAFRKHIYRRRGIIDSTHVRKPGMTLDARTEAELEAIIDRVRERHEEQDTPYFIDDEYISRLYTSFPDGQVKPYTCYTADGEMAGGIVAIEHDDTVYRWQGGTKVDVEIPVNDLLDWHIMEDAKSRGIERYDLVGANQRRICRYKSKFAPDLAAYHGARKRSTRAEAVNAARGLRELVPFPR